MTEKQTGLAPDNGLIDEADADRRRAPELDLSQRAIPTPEQNERARSNPTVSLAFNDMLRRREEARVQWLADCARRSGVSWSGLSDREPPSVLRKTFDQMIDEAIAATEQAAAYAVTPKGLLSAAVKELGSRWPNIGSLAGEIQSGISRGLSTDSELVAARTRLDEIRAELQRMSWEASKAAAILDVLGAEKEA